MEFKLKADYRPTGDQPQAIEKLTAGVEAGLFHQVLLGVTGSGKSLAFDEPIFVFEEDKDNSGAKIISIGELIDELFKKHKTQKEGDTEILFSNKVRQKLKVLSLDTISGNYEIKKINKYIRHLASDDDFILRTVCGREIEVTGDHNFWVLRKGKFQLVKTTEILKEDYLPVPLILSLPNDEKDLEGVWLTSWINRTSYFDVKNIPINVLKDKESIKEILGREKWWRVINENEKVNTRWLSKIIKDSRELRFLTVNRRNGKKVGLYQKISDDFLKFVGFYLSEGHGERNYLIISVFEKEFQKIFTNCLRNLHLGYKERNLNPGDFQLSNSLLAEVFSGWCGNKAGEKAFPPWFMELSKRQLAVMLSVYFSGDGNVTSNEVSATSASRDLISGLSYSLLRFGIKVRIRRKMKRATNSPMDKKEYFEAVISGQEDLRNFAKNIGFVLTRKQKKLESVINKNLNTNVDIIPIEGMKLKMIRDSLNWSQKDLAKKIGCERSYISMIENNERHPSRKIFKKIINAAKKVVVDKEICKEISFFETFSKIFWTKVREVRQIKPTSDYVYDVSVEDNETFLAGYGGIFVHNTFTVANVIQNTQKPTLVISHNKTLAAQLYQEFKEYFPDNAVSYFVSYYDYYQPESYIPQTDTYIAKDADINEEIDKLRLLATSHIFSRNDVIVVASVSCIYNLGSPQSYQNRITHIFKNQTVKREDLLYQFVSLYYQRSRLEFERGNFRVRGEIVEIYPSYSDEIIKIVWKDNEIEKITTRSIIEGKEIELENYFLYPAKHYLADKEIVNSAFKQIKADLRIRLDQLKKEGKDLEVNRLNQRVNYDLEMIKEVGYVNGIENYSRYFDGRSPGDPPFTLLDYFNYQFKNNFLVVVDESHMTIPQIRGMYNGDSSRKKTLVDFGFRLPSALDNRPLNFREFLQRVPQAVFVSATPSDWELSRSRSTVEQLIRPTGLVDPEVEVRPTEGQVNDLIKEIIIRKKRGERVLVTTLTKRLAEDLSTYLSDPKNTGETILVNYLHADVDTLQRTDILADLRRGTYDVIVGINLLREGLDLPEVSLVAILDADKQGFLRSKVSLIQTMGRTARNVLGKVIMYADERTDAMNGAINEVNRRREVQIKYNQDHGITPKTISKPIRDALVEKVEEEEELDISGMTPKDAKKLVAKLNKQMREYAKIFEFERAAKLRDNILKIKKDFNLE